MPSSLRQFAVLPSPDRPLVAGVWSGSALLHPGASTFASAHPTLDIHLPGGGWPLGALTEVVHPACQGVEWQLVLPALGALLAQRSGAVVLIQPPYEPCGAALQAHHVPPQRICQVLAEDGKQLLWATEQALHCRDVCAILAWLPQVEAAQLRRLQVAASERSTLLWVFRPEEERVQPSPAALRLLVQSAGFPSAPALEVQILKRRGPPIDKTLRLPVVQSHWAEVLQAALPVEMQGRRGQENDAWASGGPVRTLLRLVRP